MLPSRCMRLWLGRKRRVLAKSSSSMCTEPGTAQIYTGFIEDIKHLRRILGKHGKDLEHPAKTTEMILFVAKFHCRVVDNKITWDGEPNEEVHPLTALSLRPYACTQKTKLPLSMPTQRMMQRLIRKLIEAQKRRGIKISRQK